MFGAEAEVEVEGGVSNLRVEVVSMDLWKRDLEERRENFPTLPTTNGVFGDSRATSGNVSLSCTARKGVNFQRRCGCKSKETERSH
jgi:hypothetical protein